MAREARKRSVDEALLIEITSNFSDFASKPVKINLCLRIMSTLPSS